MPRRGSQMGPPCAAPEFGASRSSLERKTQVLLQFLIPGQEALETMVLGAVNKRKSGGMGKEAQGTQQRPTRSSSLHRECTMKPKNIHLSVLEPSTPEMSLVDGPCWEAGVLPAKIQKVWSTWPPLPAPVTFTPLPRFPHPHEVTRPASTAAAPSTRTGGRKPAHWCQHSTSTGDTASPSTPRHSFTHPGTGRDGKRGNKLPLQVPNRPTGPARQAFS